MKPSNQKENHSYIGHYHVTAEQAAPVFLSGAARAQHLYILGQTGTGKSTLLRQLIAQDIQAGRGVALFDVHGDLAEEVLELIPKARVKDVVYFDAADRAFPLGFNPLAGVPDELKSLTVDNIISAFRNFWGRSWGDRMEYVLKNTLFALLDCPPQMKVSFLSISRMLTDPRYRIKVQRHIKNPQVASYWSREFALYPNRFRQEVISPVLNKVNTLGADELLRNIIGQGETSFDIARIMDSQQIFIANLSKGKIGAKNANLLGSLLVSSFQQQALARAFKPAEERVPFYMYIDEFQNFTTEEFASIFSEARKYALSLTVAHQYLSQLTQKVREAVTGNVANIILFAISAGDAHEFHKEFEPHKVTDFTSLDRGRVIARFQGDGNRRAPIPLRLSHYQGGYGRGEKIKAQSRRKFGRFAQGVEAELLAWFAEK